MSSLLSNPAFTSTYSVVRPNASGTWVKGKWTATSSTSAIVITGSVQKLTPKETELLPESFRTRRAYRVYTQTELMTLENSTSRNSDAISIDGETYDIISVEKWTQIYPHYKAIAVRREQVAV